MGLKISTTKHGGYPLIKLEGRVIGVDDRKFSTKMETLFKQKTEKIVIDVSDADFIDSHGVGIIVYYHTLMKKEKRDLLILNANPNPVAYMTRLFEMTNLDKVLSVISNINDLK
jgi:anti-anti-sigma factor